MIMPRTAVAISPDQPKHSKSFLVANAFEDRPDAPEAAGQAGPGRAETAAGGALAAILEGIGDAFYAVDGQWRFTYVNRVAQEHFGLAAEAMLGRAIWDVFPGSLGTDLRRRCEEVLATGAAASFEARALGAPERDCEFRVFPFEGGLAVSVRDRTERRKEEDYLRESQAQLSALADNLPLGMVYQMRDAGSAAGRRFLYVSASCERITGVPAERVIEDPSALYDLLLPEFREPLLRAQAESHATGQPFDLEIAIRHGLTGELRWQRIVATRRALPGGGAVWDGLQIDITDHKHAEEHLQLLINELNHRVKNTLATVQSLSAQSFRPLNAHADDRVRAAREAFEARLFALARAHDILTRQNWEGANLAEVLVEACAPYKGGAKECTCIDAEGPSLRVPPPLALSLSMALHELFTNALKHGALSCCSGRIRIRWSTAETAAGQRLMMRWEERGGPPVAPPQRTGFGSRLIEKGLARELNGSARITYEPQGVICTIDVPLEVPAS